MKTTIDAMKQEWITWWSLHAVDNTDFEDSFNAGWSAALSREEAQLAFRPGTTLFQIIEFGVVRDFEDAQIITEAAGNGFIITPELIMAVRRDFHAKMTASFTREEAQTVKPENLWREAVLDALAEHAMDAPISEQPQDILKRIIDMAVTMAKDPSINKPKEAQTAEPVAVAVYWPGRAMPVYFDWIDGQPEELRKGGARVDELFTHPAPIPNGERAERIIELRRAAKEIADAGHAGWGNVCTDASDMLAADAQEIERLRAVVAVNHEWHMTHDDFDGYAESELHAVNTANKTPMVAQQGSANKWNCFHCGEVFTTFGSARDHFGAKPDAEPGCLIDQVALEEGGKHERGRGLLMTLRKAEAELEHVCEPLLTTLQERDAEIETARRTAEYWKAEYLAGNAVIAAQRKVLEHALEALEYMHAEKIDYMTRNNLGNPAKETATRLAVSAITALRTAIADAEACEPVAFKHNLIADVAIAHRPADLDKHPERWTPLYAAPVQAQELKPLSDDEIDEIGVDFRGDYQVLRAFTRAVETKLKARDE